MELITVFKSFSPDEAQLVRSRLEVAGYEAQVAHELGSLSMDEIGRAHV